MLASAKVIASSTLMAAPSARSARRRSSPRAAATRSPVSCIAVRTKLAFGPVDAIRDGAPPPDSEAARLKMAYAAPWRTPAVVVVVQRARGDAREGGYRTDGVGVHAATIDPDVA
jgi:hypothetical protein